MSKVENETSIVINVINEVTSNFINDEGQYDEFSCSLLDIEPTIISTNEILEISKYVITCRGKKENGETRHLRYYQDFDDIEKQLIKSNIEFNRVVSLFGDDLPKKASTYIKEKLTNKFSNGYSLFLRSY